MTTLKQVAEVAGVSMKTVSRVVNKSPNVAEKTRQHVEVIIKKMNYQPNLLARSLASGKTNAIGLLIHHSVDEIFKYPFFNALLGGISACLNEHKLDLVLRFMDDNSSYIELFDQQRVDGLILANAPLNHPDLFALVDRNVPCVFLSQISLVDNPSHWIDSDFRAGARIATRYLLELGHRYIALMPGPAHLAISPLRTQGYKDGLTDYQISVDDDYILVTDLFLESESARKYLVDYWLKLSPHPTAFIACDDLTAANITRELQQLGYRVPEDFSVIGWDNTMLSTTATPQITSVGQPTHLKGYTAANTLLEIIKHGSNTPIHNCLDMQFVVRESTGPAPAKT
jgi:DNA-binding LacI/PurR family transcriptional regulator